MATLTYDPSEDTGELSADEKESLEIGEKLEGCLLYTSDAADEP